MMFAKSGKLMRSPTFWVAALACVGIVAFDRGPTNSIFDGQPLHSDPAPVTVTRTVEVPVTVTARPPAPVVIVVPAQTTRAARTTASTAKVRAPRLHKPRLW